VSVTCFDTDDTEATMAEFDSQACLFPLGWVQATDGWPASDLELGVLLVNSLDYLADPPDRLTTIDWYTAVLREVSHAALAAELRTDDVASLRALRDELRGVFTAVTPATAAEILNPLLLAAEAVPVLVPERGGHARLMVAPDATGMPALAARLPAAIAVHVADHGTSRLGSCAAAPCECVYVDRTRAGNRRYCCDLCNDRAAAAAYRRRHAIRQLLVNVGN
jgi:predicted RNA-binding Zn ribbon-like protein